MSSFRSHSTFLVRYLPLIAFQMPIWLCGGLFFAASMCLLLGNSPLISLRAGLVWGLFMWLSLLNLVAIGVAWRRSTSMPVADEPAFRAAIDKTCGIPFG